MVLAILNQWLSVNNLRVYIKIYIIWTINGSQHIDPGSTQGAITLNGAENQMSLEGHHSTSSQHYS